MNELSTLLGQAVALARAGRLAEAAEPCRKVLERDPERAEARLLLGLAMAQLGELQAAREHLSRYLSKRTDDPNAWYNLGVVEQQAGRREQAVEAYRRVLVLAPRTLPAIINLAALLQIDVPSEADSLLRDALSTRPEEPALTAALAQLLRQQGRPDEAASVCESFRRAHGEATAVLVEQGRALEAAQRLQEARDCWQQAVQAAPSDPAPVLGLARLLNRLDENREAERQLRSLLKTHAINAEVWSTLAVVVQAQGRGREAAAAARRAVELAPQNPGYCYNLAAILSKRTDPQELRESESMARTVLELDPEHAEARHCLGLVLGKLERSTEAEQALAKAVALAPGRSDMAVSLGDFHLARGQLGEAVAVLEDAARRSPDHPAPARQLGIALLRRGQPEDALAAFERALKLDGADQRAIAHRALALQHLGRHGEAEAYLGFDRHIHQVQLTPPEGFASMDAFNRALARDIRDHSQLRWEPVGLAARNGALTEDLLADRTPAIVGFAQRLHEAIEKLRVNCPHRPADPFARNRPQPGYSVNVWATLVEGGGNIDTHIHEESWLSGAYYVELPETLGSEAGDPAGWIEFGRPHAHLSLPPHTRVQRVRPSEGLLILFPSYLFHRTIPHLGAGQRISISFDVSPRLSPGGHGMVEI